MSWYVGLSQTFRRSKVIDYSLPLLKDIVTLLAPAKKSDDAVHNYSVYLGIFAVQGWLFTATLIAFTALGFFLVARERYPEETAPVATLARGATLSARHHLHLGVTVPAPAWSVRILIWTSSIGGLLVYTYYTCDLTALTTSSSEPSYVRSFNDVIEQQYQVVVLNDSAAEEILSTSRPRSPMRRVYETTMVGKRDAFTAIREEGNRIVLDRPKHLMFGTDLLPGLDGRFVALDIEDAYKGQLAFGLRKNSEFTDLFNYHLHRMEVAGLLSRIRRKWGGNIPGKDEGRSDGEAANALDYSRVSFPFSLLPVSAVLATGVLIVEYAAARQRARMRETDLKRDITQHLDKMMNSF